MKRIIGCLIVVFLLLPFVYGGCGGDGDGKVVKLFGTTLGNGTLGPSALVMLSPETGSFISTIGPVGYYVNGLEYNEVNDTLYATTSTRDLVFPNGLIEIDMMTGISTTIGSGAGSQINNPTVNSAGAIFAWSTTPDPGLLNVDSVSGAATKVGDLGTTLTLGGGGLAFDNTDNLYLVTHGASIYTLDASTGAATFFSDIPGTSIAHHGDFHPETGLYWGLRPDPWDWRSDPSRDLLVIDVNLPAIIESLSTVEYLHAITFYYD